MFRTLLIALLVPAALCAPVSTGQSTSSTSEAAIQMNRLKLELSRATVKVNTYFGRNPQKAQEITSNAAQLFSAINDVATQIRNGPVMDTGDSLAMYLAVPGVVRNIDNLSQAFASNSDEFLAANEKAQGWPLMQMAYQSAANLADACNGKLSDNYGSLLHNLDDYNIKSIQETRNRFVPAGSSVYNLTPQPVANAAAPQYSPPSYTPQQYAPLYAPAPAYNPPAYNPLAYNPAPAAAPAPASSLTPSSVAGSLTALALSPITLQLGLLGALTGNTPSTQALTGAVNQAATINTNALSNALTATNALGTNPGGLYNTAPASVLNSVPIVLPHLSSLPKFGQLTQAAPAQQAQPQYQPASQYQPAPQFQPTLQYQPAPQYQLAPQYQPAGQFAPQGYAPAGYEPAGMQDS